YDLDIEAAATCREIGLNMVRAATVNDDPIFIQGLASIVRERLETSVSRRDGPAS
ncbi:MAG: ferrochelatase, partial [Planctomycetota bacterium]|nr:ferrochelatase [Planctomycetota bacterium]